MRDRVSAVSLACRDTAFEALPFSARCRSVFARGDHLLIGVSPGNSYFSAARIAELVDWGRDFFAAVDVVQADVSVDAQFAAAGYDAEHARRRAEKEVKATRRRIERGVAEAGRTRVGIHLLSEFLDDPVYRRLSARAAEALRTDGEFRAATERMARGFLAARGTDDSAPRPDHLAAAVDYIAAELPFFLDSPALLGAPTSIAAYHVELPLTAVLFGRTEGLRAAPGQGYAVVTPAVAASRAVA
ncbi:tRNA-dependent cyclodipeptide synthase [Kitasatospora sp. NPDC049285]|uniref:tRNA-dependent cyclodipeptide synthase n=1 Tax=Kitasatospora sp. NPDC049285 TaxID=3157096 RepID=UPI00343AF13D